MACKYPLDILWASDLLKKAPVCLNSHLQALFNMVSNHAQARLELLSLFIVVFGEAPIQKSREPQHQHKHYRNQRACTEQYRQCFPSTFSPHSQTFTKLFERCLLQINFAKKAKANPNA